MIWGTLKKINPQFALGLLIGFSVAVLLPVRMIVNSINAWTNIVALDHSVREPGIACGGVEGKNGHLNASALDLHKRLDANVEDVKEHGFNDSHLHHENDTVAQALYKQVRVLCWIMTSPQNLKKKAVHVKKTWGKRCNVLLFMSSKFDKDLPAIGLNTTEGRQHLTAKSMQAFSYAYENHLDDADWFMKADDDTYVILENLRYFLRDEDPEKSVYFGHKFDALGDIAYTSGGGGYVLSKAALKRYGEKGRKDPKICRQDLGDEDVEMGNCMRRLGVELKSSLDSLGRSRFHCFTPETFMDKTYHAWYVAYDSHKGQANISDYAISFHYITPLRMYHLEFYTYHLQPYGITHRAQDLNVKTKRKRKAQKNSTRIFKTQNKST